MVEAQRSIPGSSKTQQSKRRFGLPLLDAINHNSGLSQEIPNPTIDPREDAKQCCVEYLKGRNDTTKVKLPQVIIPIELLNDGKEPKNRICDIEDSDRAAISVKEFIGNNLTSVCSHPHLNLNWALVDDPIRARKIGPDDYLEGSIKEMDSSVDTILKVLGVYVPYEKMRKMVKDNLEKEFSIFITKKLNPRGETSSQKFFRYYLNPTSQIEINKAVRSIISSLDSILNKYSKALTEIRQSTTKSKNDVIGNYISNRSVSEQQIISIIQKRSFCDDVELEALLEILKYSYHMHFDSQATILNAMVKMFEMLKEKLRPAKEQELDEIIRYVYLLVNYQKLFSSLHFKMSNLMKTYLNRQNQRRIEDLQEQLNEIHKFRYDILSTLGKKISTLRASVGSVDDQEVKGIIHGTALLYDYLLVISLDYHPQVLINALYLLERINYNSKNQELNEKINRLKETIRERLFDKEPKKDLKNKLYWKVITTVVKLLQIHEKYKSERDDLFRKLETEFKEDRLKQHITKVNQTASSFLNTAAILAKRLSDFFEVYFRTVHTCHQNYKLDHSIPESIEEIIANPFMMIIFYGVVTTRENTEIRVGITALIKTTKRLLENSTYQMIATGLGEYPRTNLYDWATPQVATTKGNWKEPTKTCTYGSPSVDGIYFFPFRSAKIEDKELSWIQTTAPAQDGTFKTTTVARKTIKEIGHILDSILCGNISSVMSDDPSTTDIHSLANVYHSLVIYAAITMSIIRVINERRNGEKIDIK